MITTGRTLTISGGLKPVSKLHIKSIPGFGWNGSIGATVLLNEGCGQESEGRLSQRGHQLLVQRCGVGWPVSGGSSPS
jgi:hypothetical protein